MRWLGKVLSLVAIIAVGMPLEKPLYGQQIKGKPDGTPSESRRSTEETPFGGPPPPTRSMKGKGPVCKTARGTCGASADEPNGADCACTDGTGRETKGRVER